MYRVYLITNLVNNKKYVGITHNTIEHRFEEHIQKSRCKNGNWVLHRALRKYGVDNFKIELLEDNIDKEQIGEKETYYIHLYDTYNNGYNMTLGGAGTSGYRHKPGFVKTYIHKIITPERNAKISKALKGRPFDEKHKNKLSQSMKQYHQTHDNNFKGKHHTQKTKDLIGCKNTKHKILMLDKNTEEIIMEFDNAKKAGMWIVETQNRQTKPDTVRGAIIRHCMGIADCQTAYGYKWKYRE